MKGSTCLAMIWKFTVIDTAQLFVCFMKMMFNRLQPSVQLYIDWIGLISYLKTLSWEPPAWFWRAPGPPSRWASGWSAYRSQWLPWRPRWNVQRAPGVKAVQGWETLLLRSSLAHTHYLWNVKSKKSSWLQVVGEWSTPLAMDVRHFEHSWVPLSPHLGTLEPSLSFVQVDL